MGLPQMGSNGGIQKWLVYNGKSMKIPPSNGWELGVPLFQETSKWVRRLTFKARSEPRSATDPVGSSLTPMAPGQEPTIQMVFCHQNTWSDRWHVTHSMTWENHIKSNVSSPKSTSSRIIRFFTGFQSRSQLSEELFMVSTCALQNAACGVPASRSCRMCCEVRARCDDVSSLETSHERVGPKILGKKTTPKMDRLENPEETVMFWNPTCSFF